MSLFDKKLSELHSLLHKKEISVSDLVDTSYKRINEEIGRASCRERVCIYV